MKSILIKVAVSVTVSVVGTILLNKMNKKLNNGVKSTYTYIQL